MAGKAGLILKAQIQSVIMGFEQLWNGLQAKNVKKTWSECVRRKTDVTDAGTYSLPVSPTNARLYSTAVTCFSSA
jgi:hypothetical protein